ncbi:hypothetical protein [Roseivirga thermotolerans]|uniref:Uncharacterized protein n=1 Tax=Roseivirga thermotolerans TaxID=1758176 RepID=A0ABQ3I813_9BACT|nr:hypothetical protein [Roseivirga thermotolerans]GHE65124.1 hypothetical protein GCM10011340_20220 [Roseivirga thermotolerans]
MTKSKPINETHELLNIIRSIKGDITQGNASKGLWPTVLNLEVNLKNKVFSPRDVRYVAIANRADKLQRLLPKSVDDYTPKHHRIVDIITLVSNPIHA